MLLNQTIQGNKVSESRAVDIILVNMLLQTIEDYLKGDKLAVEDVDGGKCDGIFTFSHMCKHFNLNENMVKSKIRTMTLQGFRKAKHSASFRVPENKKREVIKIKTCPTCKAEFVGDNKFCPSGECRQGHQKNSGRHLSRRKTRFSDFVYG